jgi:small subunit ribosomal protein S20
MPILKSAKKKLKKDIKKTKQNEEYLLKINKVLKTIKKDKDDEVQQLIKKAYSIIDKAAKRSIIHKNKAARLKSKMTKFISKSKKKIKK